MIAGTQHLERLALAVEEFRRIYPDAPILSFQVFLTIALNPGINGLQLIKRLGVSQSAVSRHQMLLSAWTWQGRKPGLDLVETLEDPFDRRGKIAFLTAKGRTLASVLLRILDPESQVDPSAFVSAKEYLRNSGAR